MKEIISRRGSLLGKNEQYECYAALAAEITHHQAEPLKAYIELKALGVVIKKVLDDSDVKNVVIDEVSKYPEKEAFGVKVELASTAGNYDYSGVDKWVELDEAITAMTLTKKILEQALKAQYKAGLKVASMDDGAEMEVKCIHPGSETIKITFKK